MKNWFDELNDGRSALYRKRMKEVNKAIYTRPWHIMLLQAPQSGVELGKPRISVAV